MFPIRFGAITQVYGPSWQGVSAKLDALSQDEKVALYGLDSRPEGRTPAGHYPGYLLTDEDVQAVLRQLNLEVTLGASGGENRMAIVWAAQQKYGVQSLTRLDEAIQNHIQGREAAGAPIQRIDLTA